MSASLLEDVDFGAAPRPRLGAEAIELWRLAWPAMTRSFLTCASDRVTLIFVGLWDPAIADYDGAALGKMYSNVTGLSIGMGLCYGLATLTSQAFGRGRAAAENATHFRRCLAILACALCFSAGAAACAEAVLSALGQPPPVCLTSARYARVQLVGVPFFWLSTAMQSVCDGLQRTKIGMYGNLAGALAQVVLTLVACHPALLGWGYLGMAAARSASGVVCAAVLVTYIHCAGLSGLVWRRSDGREAGRLTGLEAGLESHVCNRAALLGYLAIALPAALITWMEWWSFEFLALLVGYLPSPEVNLAAHGTLFNIVVTTYMVWRASPNPVSDGRAAHANPTLLSPQAFAGISTALCALTGRRIGEGLPNSVPRLCAIALCYSALFVGAIVACLYLLRAPLAAAFTPKAAVRRAVEGTMLATCLSVPGYAVLMTLFGACRGANRQRLATLGVLVGYAAIGLPLGYYLGAVRHWPSVQRALVGVWCGNAVALAFAATWIVVVVSRVDWPRVRPVPSVQ